MPFALLDLPTFLSQIARNFLNPSTFFLNTFSKTPNYSPSYLIALLSGTIGGRLSLSPIAAFPTYFSLVGVFYALVRHKKQDVIIISYLVATFALILPGVSTGWTHYWLPMIPFLLLLGARLLSDVVKAIKTKVVFLRRFAIPILAGVSLLIIWAPASLAIKQTSVYLKGYKTGWTDARDWIENNIPSGANLAVETESLSKFPTGMYNLKIFPSGELDVVERARHALEEYKKTGVNYLLTYNRPPSAGMQDVRLISTFPNPVHDVLFGPPLDEEEYVDLWEINPWTGSIGKLHSTLHIGQVRERTINSASFEDTGEVWKNWFVEAAELTSPKATAIAEIANKESTNGQYSLHLQSYSDVGINQHTVAQVISHKYLDELENFQMDFFPISIEMLGTENRIELIVTAKSAGGVILANNIYLLYDHGLWKREDQVNILKAPGFEESDQNKLHNAWKNLSYLAVINQKNQHTGTRSLRIGEEGYTRGATVRQDIEKIKPNTTYHFKLYTKGNRGTAQVLFLDNNGKGIPWSGNIQLFDSYGHWRKYVFKTKSPPEASRAEINLHVPKGVTFFDDFYFGEAPKHNSYWKVSRSTRLDTWNTFQRNLKKDLKNRGVKLSMVQFITIRLQVRGGSKGSGSGAYFDNLRTDIQHKSPSVKQSR